MSRRGYEYEMTASQMVREFHETYGIPIQRSVRLPDSGRRELRWELLREEFEECRVAESKDNIVEIADALADMLYIIHGTALEYGIPLDRVFDEVHRSNMSKLGGDGKPIRRADGKVLKGPGYFKPDIESVLFHHGLIREK